MIRFNKREENLLSDHKQIEMMDWEKLKDDMRDWFADSRRQLTAYIPHEPCDGEDDDCWDDDDEMDWDSVMTYENAEKDNK